MWRTVRFQTMSAISKIAIDIFERSAVASDANATSVVGGEYLDYLDAGAVRDASGRDDSDSRSVEMKKGCEHT